MSREPREPTFTLTGKEYYDTVRYLQAAEESQDLQYVKACVKMASRELREVYVYEEDE